MSQLALSEDEKIVFIVFISPAFQTTSRNYFEDIFFYFICIKCKHSLLALILNIAFSEFTDDFQIAGNMLCLWQTSWEIYECNKSPVLQGSLNKLTCQHNENKQQAAVGSQGAYKTAQGQEVLEINNLYTLSSAFQMWMKIIVCVCETRSRRISRTLEIDLCVWVIYQLGQGK